MIYKIGYARELSSLPLHLPDAVQAELHSSLTILDSEYGENRDYMQDDGGYVLIIESIADLQAMKSIVDYEVHPCEWATKHDTYLSALYILSNDYVILACMPSNIAPDKIIKELEG